MLNDLLAAKKITLDEYETYTLFQLSDMGRKWFHARMKEVFMEMPICKGVAFAYTQGSGLLLRNIWATVDKVNDLLKESENDNSRASG